MRQLKGFVKASHLGPTLAVTLVITTLGWSLGWRSWPLAGVLIAVLVGQLSVGWSNDAFDAELDRRSERFEKPTVSAGISARQLWIAATCALVLSCLMSLLVAGVIGGSWHVFALAMAWLYNTVLSRTWWSWLPYALAFGAVPAFLTFGLSGESPPWWLVLSFSIIGVSAHVANALPDIESDTASGSGGFAISLGRVRATRLCWILLILGTLVLATESGKVSLWFPAVLVAAIAGAWTLAHFSRNRSAVFTAILACVFVELVVLLISVSH
jgi:4-hydroxybenzoate polyprenyltransferase